MSAPRPWFDTEYRGGGARRTLPFDRERKDRTRRTWLAVLRFLAGVLLGWWLHALVRA